MQFTMTKIKLLFVLLCMSTVFANAQEIKVKSFQKLDKDLFARTNPRFDLNEEPCTVIRFITTGKGLQFEGNVIGEPLYFAGETLIYMPDGSKRVVIKHPDYGVLRYEFPTALDKQSVYEIPLKLIENPDNRTRALFIGTVNVSTKGKVTPGVMLGFVKKWGAYIKGVSDFSLNASDANYEMDNNGNYNGVPVWFADPNPIQERTAITFGALYRPWKRLYTYAGMGFGSRNVIYEAPNETWVKNVDRSNEGFEAECGIIFRLGGFSLMLGVQTNQFKYMEYSGGLGVIF